MPPRIAKPRMPERYAREYYRKVKAKLRSQRVTLWRTFQRELIPLIHAYRRQTVSANSLTANNALEEIRAILSRLREAVETDTFSVAALDRLVRRFINQTNAYSRAEFRQQVSRVLGFDPTVNEPWLSRFLETTVQNNILAIRSVANQYLERVEQSIILGLRQGTAINDIAQQVAHASDVSISRARFIARDQMGTVYGELTRRRQEEAGLTRFRWSTSHDERVRSSHRRLDGKIFTWSTGAEGDGRRIFPGTDYGCRCTAEIIVEDLVEVSDR